MKSMKRRFIMESDGDDAHLPNSKQNHENRQNKLDSNGMLLLQCKSIILTLQRQNASLSQDNARKDQIILYLTQQKQDLQHQIVQYEKRYISLEQQTQNIIKNQQSMMRNRQSISDLKERYANQIDQLQKQLSHYKQTHHKHRYDSPYSRAIGKISSGKISSGKISNEVCSTAGKSSDREYTWEKCRTDVKKQLFVSNPLFPQNQQVNPEQSWSKNKLTSIVSANHSATQPRNESFQRMDICIAKVEKTLREYSNLLLDSDQE